MGYLSAVAMTQLADDDTALRWHLQSNHYPPLPLSLLPVAREVITLAALGCWEYSVDLPEGISYREQSSAPVSACVEAWHLGAFIDAVLEDGGEN